MDSAHTVFTLPEWDGRLLYIASAIAIGKSSHLLLRWYKYKYKYKCKCKCKEKCKNCWQLTTKNIAACWQLFAPAAVSFVIIPPFSIDNMRMWIIMKKKILMQILMDTFSRPGWSLFFSGPSCNYEQRTMRKRSPIIVLPLFLEIFNINPLFLLIVLSSAAQGSSNIYLDNAANGRNFLENVAEHIIVLFGRAHHCYTLLCFS